MSLPVHMTWKSTVAASGVMLVGTWLASYAPVGGPRQETAVPPSAAHTETAAAEIQREAERLHGRLSDVAAYRLPARNPFRFGEAPVRTVPAHEPVVEIAPAAPVIEPPTLRVKLSGIAEDGEGDAIVRTAVISTPDNVHLVKVGDTIGNVFKVTKVTADSVELERLADGSTVQLVLRR